METTRHEYRVTRMWEENPEIFLNDQALLPLAPLAATKQPQILLQQVVERANQVSVEKRGEISAYDFTSMADLQVWLQGIGD